MSEISKIEFKTQNSYEELELLNLKNGIDLRRMFVTFVKRSKEDKDFKNNVFSFRDITAKLIENEYGCLVAKFFRGEKEIAGLDVQDSNISAFEFTSIVLGK